MSEHIWETVDGLFKTVYRQDKRVEALERRIIELERRLLERSAEERTGSLAARGVAEEFALKEAA